MNTLAVVALTQIATAYLWYPVTYRLTARTNLPPANERMYEYHRPYAYLLGVAMGYIMPAGQAQSFGYWVTLLVVIPLGAAFLAAMLARVRREELRPTPLLATQPRKDGSLVRGEGIPARQMSSVSHDGRRKRTIRSKTPH